ncbi:MAG: c-type cytochrome [Cytophagales bacterium]|jgi:mono/diheme cytochrome c family protein|nr:c-type cytochrome [Cytophagales bacterium]MCA6388494.1 c-type cytochrome [Cytophagales bacterium]MCA6390919.1 c-type cytochrome [Cytophagales bacterium]MCA6394856.1 c-type cytochrome [Cytophagales bacterium]MCA6402535.1 c-type cytochrome [Cytophagales bacterium]
MMKDRLSDLVKLLTLVLFVTTSFTSFAQEIPTDAAAISAGEALFNGNCKSCHRVKQKLVGPALAGVENRAPSIAWIIEWVKNPAKKIASGDEYANKIYNEYNKSQMTAFTSYTDAQILSILAYVKADAEKVEVAPAAAQQTAGGGSAGVPSSYLNAIVGGMLLILLLMLVILGLIVSALKKYLNQKELSEDDQQVVNSPYTFATITRSSGFIFLVVFIVAAVGFKTTIDGLYSIGVQQDYQPKQPIAFSHKLHAGSYEIDCKYCHTGVLKGKQANIPSPNICMNCHTQIKQESPEIQKIYAAIGYDSKTASYTGKQKPIEWVRIHNLPDLAYFNHAQHVNVGGIECQTCHGPVQEMEVVKQYSLLTMGWCIDCHRKTDVNTKDNEYYNKLNELHLSAKKSKMKVEDIGGLECAKCHY